MEQFWYNRDWHTDKGHSNPMNSFVQKQQQTSSSKKEKNWNFLYKHKALWQRGTGTVERRDYFHGAHVRGLAFDETELVYPFKSIPWKIISNNKGK